MRTTLKNDTHLNSYLIRKNALIKEFSTTLNQKDRDLIATHVLNKETINLQQGIFQKLEKMEILEAYEDVKEGKSKQSTPFREAVSKDFIKLCLVEKNYRNGLYLQEDEKNYHEIAEALDLVDPPELKRWLETLIKWTRLQDFKLIKAEHAYKREAQESEINILDEGRKLIENGYHLEVYRLDIDRLHVEIESDLWSVICLLAKYRVETIVEFYPRIIDPFGRFFIYLILNIRNDRFQLGLSYIKSAEASLVWIGLKICLEFLKQLEELYASSDINHHIRKNDIISRRKSKLEILYSCIWRELFATGQVQAFADFDLILKHFDVGRKKLKQYQITELENIDRGVFVNSSIEWMLLHPETVNGLPKITSPYDIELRLHWMGQYLVSNKATPSINENINNYIEFFLGQIRNKDHRYWFQITDDHKTVLVNSWISFFSGVLKHRGWENVWSGVETELSKIKWNETNFWKPSDSQFATDDVLTFCAIIFSYSCQNSDIIDSSKLSDILGPLKNIIITTHTTSGNWDILLRFLITHQKDNEVQIFVENTILKDGVPPDVVSLIPAEMLQNNPALLARAKEQIISYKNFFNKEFEKCKQQLQDKGIL